MWETEDGFEEELRAELIEEFGPVRFDLKELCSPLRNGQLCSTLSDVLAPTDSPGSQWDKDVPEMEWRIDQWQAAYKAQLEAEARNEWELRKAEEERAAKQRRLLRSLEVLKPVLPPCFGKMYDETAPECSGGYDRNYVSPKTHERRRDPCIHRLNCRLLPQ